MSISSFNLSNLNASNGDTTAIVTSGIVFIDPKVDEYETLMAGVKAGLEVVLLDDSLDGITQITKPLKGRRGLSSLHIVAHGDAGSLWLGNGLVNSNTLDQQSDDLQSWGAALAPDADILLYGCKVAAGETGQQFVQLLSQLTGADVAASNNLVGSSALDGDWNLEVRTGTIEAPLAFEQLVLAAYKWVLPLFSTATNFDVDQQPTSVAIGDFNGDGLPDIATTNDMSNNLSILLGTGTGSFGLATNFTVRTSFSRNSLLPYPQDIALGDFNRDGLLDLATANLFSYSASVLLGTGTGSFGAPTHFTTWEGPQAIAAGDFNQDGNLDLATANYFTKDVSILLGTGTGSFSAATNFSIGSTPRDVAVGDFNGDSNLDLAIVNDNNVSMLLGTGTGSFGAATNFAVGTYPTSVAVEDFNGDGLLDLTTANGSSNDVSILLGTGTGSFGAATNFAVGTSPTSVVVGDFNGDGLLDLATANTSSNTVSMLLGTGTGSFGAATKFDVGSGPVKLAVGDFNGDGLADLATANHGSNSVSILLNDTAATNSYIVTNTNDSGSGSLRAAIEWANSNPGTDTISFYIAGTAVQTITPLSELPMITDSVIIDGTTQPGFSGTPIIELNGSSAGAGVSGLVITAGNSTVKGLAINRFNSFESPNIGIIGGSGIELWSSGNVIQGNYIGTDVTGTVDLGNSLTGLKIYSSNNTIGGTTAGARNIISGNDVWGVLIWGSGNVIQGNYIGSDVTGTVALDRNTQDGVIIAHGSNNTIGGTAAGAGNLISGNGTGVYIWADENIVQGNYIGTDVTGTADLGNFTGVGIYWGDNNTIGGTAAGAGNLISGNDSAGVLLINSGTTETLVQANYIGTQANGTSPLGNSGHGVYITGSANNTIGGTAAGAGNTIAFNDGDGVFAERYDGNGNNNTTGNRVLSNAIFSNTGLGIDLGINGVTANDTGDGDTTGNGNTGANNLQNFPVLTSASISGGNTNIVGTFNSTASNTFTIQFFSNTALVDSGYGEGKTFLGSTTVTTDADGNTPINFTLPTAVPVGQFISATATNQTTNDTSEFSAGQVVVPLTVSIAAGTTPGETWPATGEFNLILNAPAPADGLTVNYTVGGTATSTNDYMPLTGSVTFAAGATTAQIDVVPVDDAILDASETVLVTLTTGTGYTISAANSTTLTITDNDGTAGNDTLPGGEGNDVLNGGLGHDSMFGGIGNDTYYVDSIGDVVTENPNAGTDTVYSSISYTLDANLENLTLTGTSAINGTGNSLNNAITGNSGNNTLNGGAGIDTLIGGDGDDTYIVDTTTDTITETATGGIDTVQSSVSYTLGANLEKLTLTGTSAINGTGNSLNNIITANGANNTLYGGYGSDVLYGGNGNDYLDGGTGDDSLIGGIGDDTYYVDSAGDVVTENPGEGIDTIISSQSFLLSNKGNNVENLTLTGSAFSGDGNDLNNVIIGNTQANNLTGGIGNDTIDGVGGNDNINGDYGNDILSGGYGNDTLIGIQGNDLLSGGDGMDLMVGYGNTSGEIDTLVGGAGYDTFGIGVNFARFGGPRGGVVGYTGDGDTGYALIQDWQSDDVIELKGRAFQYTFAYENRPGIGTTALDTTIYYNGTNGLDLIGVVQDANVIYNYVFF